MKRLLARLLPVSLFGRLLLVGVLFFLGFRILAFLDMTFRPDSLFWRTNVAIESKILAHHIRLLREVPLEKRAEAVLIMGKDPELRVELLEQEPEIEPGDKVLSEKLVTGMEKALHRAGMKDLELRVSLRVWPKKEQEKSWWPSVLRARAGKVSAAVRLESGMWLHLVHSIDQIPNTEIRYTLIRLPIETLVLILLGVSMIFWIVRPLQRMTAAMERTLDTLPLPEDQGPAELRRTAKAFNAMRLRIRDFMDQRVLLFSSISHDLRTPLTRLRLRLESLSDDVLRERVLRDVDQVQQTLTHALDAVRVMQSTQPIQEVDKVHVMALLESLAEDREAMGQNVQLRGEIDGAFWLPPALVRNCLDNIIGNAVRYGGSAEVLLSQNADFLCIEVLDSGPGIPDSLQELVFEPFYRFDGSRNQKTGGYGLGLAIARTLARQCGGDVTLMNRPEGGLCVRVTLRATPVREGAEGR